ncbi:MAG: AAA family ATPase, partial [Gemmatimonadota bacterium]|nr:AAA family ATPase [Gemmatimonadota bacterium]
MAMNTESAGHQLLRDVERSVHQRVVGQGETVRGLLVALLTGGHVLLEGLPGLAKTLLVRSLAGALQASFRRIQFTPDLLPGDIVGTPVYDPATGGFRVHEGPIFANIVLADEVNRAPPKVQSALLEAMEEEQVTIDGTPHPLPAPFLVLATQNPIEQQGTYPLAEAQLDRFMLKLHVSYPDRAEEKQILQRVALGRKGAPGVPAGLSIVRGPEALPAGAAGEFRTDGSAGPDSHPSRGATETGEGFLASLDAVFAARGELERVHVDERIQDYIVDLTFATREPARAGLPELESLLEFGISPRGTIFLTRGARALAYLEGRDYVLPDDVKAIAPSVLRHRL